LAKKLAVRKSSGIQNVLTLTLVFTTVVGRGDVMMLTVRKIISHSCWPVEWQWKKNCENCYRYGIIMVMNWFTLI